MCCMAERQRYSLWRTIALQGALQPPISAPTAHTVAIKTIKMTATRLDIIRSLLTVGYPSRRGAVRKVGAWRSFDHSPKRAV
jgi:hypothetical protein